jgi:hypothetical protein
MRNHLPRTATVAVGTLAAALTLLLGPATSATADCPSTLNGHTSPAILVVNAEDNGIRKATETMEIAAPYLNPCSNPTVPDTDRWALGSLPQHRRESLPRQHRLAEALYPRGPRYVFFMTCCGTRYSTLGEANLFMTGGVPIEAQIGEAYEMTIEIVPGLGIQDPSRIKGKIVGPGINRSKTIRLQSNDLTSAQYLCIGGLNTTTALAHEPSAIAAERPLLASESGQVQACQGPQGGAFRGPRRQVRLSC